MIRCPDIRRAELELEAAKLDVLAARAEFFPSLRLTAGIGYEAFNAPLLFSTPQSMLYSAAGELLMLVFNRKAINAGYFSSNARQTQAVVEYEQAILNGYIEVVNELTRISNLEKSFLLKSEEVDVLRQSINIANVLFKSARADYMEVLLTQRDALNSRMELIETRKEQWEAMVNAYRALGGGWQ